MTTPVDVVETTTPKKHAILAPSKAEQWMTCPGSISLGLDQPDKESTYAIEGTAAHELSAVCLETETSAFDYLGQPIADTGVIVTEDMAKYVMVYVERVRALRDQGGILCIEEVVPLAHITGEQDGEGTSDCVIIREDAELIVGDLKFGRGVQVDAEKNSQMMMYALGVLEKHQLWEQVSSVRMFIDQPRLNHYSEWVCSVDELKRFHQEAAAKARPIMARLRNATLPALPLVPSEKACKFCKAKGVCPELAQLVVTSMTDGFTNIDETIPKAPKVTVTATGDELGDMMVKADLAELWITAIRAQAEIELLAGRPVKGFKLVQGKKGSRKWTDEAAVETLMKEKFRFKGDEMYTKELISPTKAEELMKKDMPKRWEQVQEFIMQKDGCPSVAPESDKRPALVMEKPLDGFEDLTSEEDISDLL
jgi:hypothetical protein